MAKLPAIVEVVQGQWDFGLDQNLNSLDLLDPDIFVFAFETTMSLGMDNSTWDLTTRDNALSYDNSADEDDSIFDPSISRAVGSGMMIGMSIKGFYAMPTDESGGGLGNFIY